MPRIIQYPTYMVYLMTLILIAGIGITAGAVWLLTFGQQVLQNEPPATPWAMLAVGVFIFGLPGAFGYLSAKYTRIILEPGQLTLETCFSFKSVLLRDVTRLLWVAQRDHPRMIVQTVHDKLKINLYGLSLNAQRRLILFLRQAVPFDVQEGWDHFGWSRAKKVLEKRKLSPAERQRKIDEGAQFMTRRDIDLLWLKMTVAMVPVAALTVWLTNELRLLMIIAAPTAVLLQIRFIVPRHGIECPPIVTSRSFWWVLIGSATTICLVFGLILDVNNNPGRWLFIAQNKPVFGWIMLTLVFVIPYGVLIATVHKERKQRLKEIDELKNNAKSDWRKLESKYRIRDEDLIQG